MDETLTRHRERAETLRNALEHLMGLHRRLADLRAGLVRRPDRSFVERETAAEAIRGEERALVDEIRALRAKHFGEGLPTAREQHLTGTVDSIEPVHEAPADFV